MLAFISLVLVIVFVLGFFWLNRAYDEYDNKFNEGEIIDETILTETKMNGYFMLFCALGSFIFCSFIYLLRAKFSSLYQHSLQKEPITTTP